MGGTESNIRLLSRCADFTLAQAAEVQSKVLKELKQSGATRHAMTLRLIRLQRSVLAIGMFSLFESFLQDAMGWREPFVEIPRYLREHDRPDLSQHFKDYRDAINVLLIRLGSS